MDYTITDSVLVESRSARTSQLLNFSDDRAFDALNKAKALVMAVWQGTRIATNKQIAEFFEVGLDAVESVLRRNREELEQDGVKVLKGSDLKSVSASLTETSGANRLTIWTPRGALRLGMLLQESTIAQQLRSLLLDIVEATNPKIQSESIIRDLLQLVANLERRIASREREYDRLNFLLTVGQGEHRFAESQRLDVEKRLTEVERQMHLATLERIGFPDPTVEVAKLTTRFSLVEHVRGYAEQYQQPIPDCWTLIHNAFRNRYHIDLVACGKNCRPTKSGCEYAEANGHIEELYAIARKFLR